MDMSLFPYFLVSSILLTMTPGPDNLYLLAKSIADGARAGIILAAGLASGIVFHTCLVILGVAALVKSSPIAFAALKYVGAAYLFYLAYGAFTAKVAEPQPTETAAGQATVAGSNITTNDTTNSVSSNETSSQASSDKSSSQPSNGESSAFAIYRKGLIMNILNPKFCCSSSRSCHSSWILIMNHRAWPLLSSVPFLAYKHSSYSPSSLFVPVNSVAF